MKCRQAKKLLSPYIDDELSDAERAALEEHLESCEACRAELEALKEISEGLRGIYRDVKAPPDFVDKLMKRIQELEEEKAACLAESGPLVFPKNWFKVAAAAALAVSLGLGIFQYSRAQGAGSIGGYSPGYPVAEAPAGEEKLPDGNLVKNSENPVKGTEDEKFVPPSSGSPKQVAEEGGLPGTAKRNMETIPGVEGQKKKAEVAPEGASGDTAVREPVAFLSRARHVATTMLELEVENLAYAKEAVAALAEAAGAGRPKEIWVYQQEQIILRSVLPAGNAAQFVERVSKLGKVLDREREITDITREFNGKLLEYQELAVRQDREGRSLAEALKQDLQNLDRETVEAGSEVVNVWLKLRRAETSSQAGDI